MPANIQAQQRELRKNYIRVVSNKFEEQCPSSRRRNPITA
ncbi:MAG: hypothetical protein QOJ15_4357 [Bradyrhizobium sp.]|jgi:hypothetical protein|nr:hypothetical protein [Bradyrhizobium sp.]